MRTWADVLRDRELQKGVSRITVKKERPQYEDKQFTPGSEPGEKKAKPKKRRGPGRPKKVKND